MAAKKGNDYAKGNKGGGRPPKFKEEYIDQVYKFALLGATDKELASFFDISETLLNTWKKEIKEFSLALKKGKLKADANVAESLYKKAVGFTNEEVKIFTYEGSPIIVPYTAYYAPDTAAINIWLKNRRGKVPDSEGQRWADKQEHGFTDKDGNDSPILVYKMPDNGRG